MKKSAKYLRVKNSFEFIHIQQNNFKNFNKDIMFTLSQTELDQLNLLSKSNDLKN